MRMLLFLILPFLFCLEPLAAADFSLITFKKSGTHLIMKLLYKLDARYRNTSRACDTTHTHIYRLAHFHYMNEVNEILNNPAPHKIIVNVRDLRDVAISNVEWYIERNHPPFTSKGKVPQRDWLNLSFDDQLLALFQPEIWGISVLLRDCANYKQAQLGFQKHDVYYTSFENLVGSKGGGDDALQAQEVYNIAHFIGHPISFDEAQKIASSLWGSSNTFRKGVIGRWKHYFTSDHIDAARPHLSDLLIDMAYEEDDHWEKAL